MINGSLSNESHYGFEVSLSARTTASRVGTHAFRLGQWLQDHGGPLSHIFERFFTTKEQGHSRPGLAKVYSIIQQIWEVLGSKIAGKA